MGREHVAQPAVVLAAQRVGALIPQLCAHPRRPGQIGEEDRHG
jgi:hypothetical protein